MTFDKLHTLQNVIFQPCDFYNSKFDSTFYMSAHANSHIEIMYCRSGECDVEIYPENAKSKKGVQTLHLNSKQFILLDAGLKHRLVINSKKPVIIMCVEWEPTPVKDVAHELLDFVAVDARVMFDKLEGLKRFLYNSDSYVIASDSGNLENGLLHYIHLLSEKGEGFSSLCYLTISFVQVLLELDKSLLPSNYSTGIVYIRKAQDYIKNNFQRDIFVGDIAEASGVNKAYLQRLFKAHVGMSIVQSLNYFRIEKCKQLLVETNLTITEICEHTGFNNRQHLIYEFKNQTGVTPTVYRNSFMNNPSDRT